MLSTCTHQHWELNGIQRLGFASHYSALHIVLHSDIFAVVEKTSGTTPTVWTLQAGPLGYSH
jgi:hypothetical protein